LERTPAGVACAASVIELAICNLHDAPNGKNEFGGGFDQVL
jgi:hypothetical protein